MTSPHQPLEIEFNSAHAEGTNPPVEFLRAYVTNPVRTYAMAFGCHLVLLAIAGISFFLMGSTFLNYSTNVALHLWTDPWFVRNDALTEGSKVCSHNVGGSALQKQQEQERIPAGFFEYTLSLVYTADDGNMLTVEKLKMVKDLEDFVVGHKDYPKFCLREPNRLECAMPKSPILACNPRQCGIVQLFTGDLTPQEGCGDLIAVGKGNLTPATDCSPRKSFPAGVFQCENSPSFEGPCDRKDWTINEAFLEKKLNHYTLANFPVDAPERDFLFAVDSSFGGGPTVAASLKSDFIFGFPLKGYLSTGDRPEEQKDKIEEFMKDAYFEKLDNYNADNKGIGFKIGYRGGTLAGLSSSALLNGDFMYVIFAFGVVMIFVMFMMGSLFYSIMALFQIFMCFFGAFLIYRLVYGAFFGVFHVMGIFLLLGIGVDGVFVFNDHFLAAPTVDESYNHDMHGRLSWTWRKVSIACGVTSLTTATSFFFNATSAFPGIAAFGAFAGCLMVALYVSMLLFWPAVVTFNQWALKDMPLAVCARGAPEEGSDGKELKEEETKPVIVSFFENQFSYLILQYRMRILFFFLMVTVFMVNQVSKLEAAKEAPSLLPEDHPINQYQVAMKENFVRGGSQFNTKVKVAFGFASDPLNRDGKDKTGTGYGAPKDEVGTLGTINWDPSFTHDNGTENWGAIQGSFECMVLLCDSAEVKDSKRNTGGLPSYKVSGCFARDVKVHLKEADLSTWEGKWASILSGDEQAFKEAVQSKVAADRGFVGDLQKFTFTQLVEGDELLHRYSAFEVKLTSNLDLEYTVGNELASNWDAWLKTNMDSSQCKDLQYPIAPFITSTHFHQFKVTETLMGEMQRGVITSISVAFVVLILVTGNYIVGSVAAFGIAMTVLWVMAMIPLLGGNLGIVENIILVMVPGLSVDFTAHMAESYNQAKSEDRDHRVVHALEHSGVSIISGAMSTSLAGICLTACQITFFVSFGKLLLFTIFYAVLFSLFFFPSAMSLFGPVGEQGDWHKYVYKKQAE